MADFLLIVIAALIVAGIVFGAASFTLGRDRGLTPPRPDGVPYDLPPDRPLDRADVDELRLDTALRGYRMDQVDDLLSRIADDLDFLYARIADLEDQLAGPVDEGDAGDEGEIELPTFADETDQSADEKTEAPEGSPLEVSEAKVPGPNASDKKTEAAAEDSDATEAETVEVAAERTGGGSA